MSKKKSGRKNDLAKLNLENPKAIIGEDADENLTYHYAEDCESEEAFLRAKAESDTMYLNQRRGNHQYERNKVTLLDQDAPSPSAEEILFDYQERAEREEFELAVVRKAAKELTPTQQRRYYSYNAEGLSYREIARIEGVNHKSVWRSVQQAKKIIKKIICKLSVNYGPQIHDFLDLSEGGNNTPSLKLENRIHSVKGTKPARPRG